VDVILRAVRQACRLFLSKLVALGLLTGCSADPQPRMPPAPEVVVSAVRQDDVSVFSDFVGTTEGFNNAEIRPQVEGYLRSRAYHEGDEVEAGQLLFEIDPRQFEAQLAQARGELGEAKAQLERTRIEVERYRPLAAKGAVSQQELDNAVQAKLRNEAAVDKAQAQVEQARLDLGWTKIESPISGIAGISVAQIGDLVSPQTTLTTVSQVDPIKVEFPISESTYLALARGQEKRGRYENKLELFLADGSRYAHEGTPFVVGREVDPRTGTILIEGRFANPQHLLRPGQFARIRTAIRVLKNALVVPQKAVRDSQGSFEVAVLGKDDEVEFRGVELGPVSGSDRVVTKGLALGDRVVVEGLQKIKTGMKVRPTSSAKAAAPPAPSATKAAS